MTADVPGILDRSALAAPPRTLIDVLRATTLAHPDASALEDADGALSYRELMARVVRTAARLSAAGVRRGDRVGIRMPSGSRELYIAILGAMAAGAAYVPVDADDPEERARLVFGEAGVRGVISGRGAFEPTSGAVEPDAAPRGAVRRDAAAPQHARDPRRDAAGPRRRRVDHLHLGIDRNAEGRRGDASLGGGLRRRRGGAVPAGCAARARATACWPGSRWPSTHPARRCGSPGGTAPASCPRPAASCAAAWTSVRGWSTHGISVVSTVPTLAALWPAEAIENVRLLIFGGEAVPPELAARLVSPEREVWNTYGPTEATVVACAAILDGVGPVRIGLPLDGWALAVVDAEGHPVGDGETGELIIGGVGLARYLDPEKDAAKYSPMPTLGWQRAYRSGDLVVFDREGLLFQGRADDQVKVGGRRIELGEIESALQALPGVSGAAAAVRRTEAGNQVLVGYLSVTDGFDRAAARARLVDELPAALVPLLAVVDELPTRTSGKVDRAALPWPLPGVEPDAAGLGASAAWLAEQWQAVLGVPVSEPDASFFDLGGGSLAAAQLVSRIRVRDPEFTVADIYDHPRLGSMADELEARAPEPGSAASHVPAADPDAAGHAVGADARRRSALHPERRAMARCTCSRRRRSSTRSSDGFGFLPTVPLWVLLVGLAIFATPFGRMAIAVAGARILLAGLEPGDYPRGGAVHLRMWLADQIAHQVDAVGLAGRPVGDELRPRARREDRRGRRPAHAAARHRHAHDRRPRRDRARGRPRRLLDRRRRRAHRPGAHRRRARRSARAARCCRAPGSARAPRSRRARRSSAACPSGQRWAGSPAERIGPAAPAGRRAAPAAPAGSSPTAPRRSSSRCCRSRPSPRAAP